MVNEENIRKLIKEATDMPILEYTNNIKELKNNAILTLNKVKRRLGALQSLISMLEIEIMLSHDEESV